MRKKNSYKTWVEIDKAALAHNIAQFRKLIGPDKKLMAVVKSNAYGHGLVNVAKMALENGADWFGVDSIYEAIELRKNNIKAPILILGYTPLSKLRDVVENDVRLVMYNREAIEELSKQTLKNKRQVNVHLKVETGTSRQGLEKEDILELAKFVKGYPRIEIEGLYTHFANIEDTTDHSYATEQLRQFKEAINLLEKNKVKIPIKHTACTAAIILFSETHFDMVRMGIGAYGLWSSTETLASAKEKRRDFELKPVLSWKTKVAQIKKIKAGTPVSYGLTERVSKDSKIAILPIGYGDGFDRKLSSVGNVLIKGKRCKVLGRVCMNMIIVDISHVSDVKPEDEVIILGKQVNEQITAEEIAQKIGTINYELVTRINPLIPRIVK